MQYEEVKKKGKTHMKFVSGEGTFKPSSIVFHFDNLFNGDKLLGDEINRVVNENWKLLFEDIEDTFLDAMTKILINILNHFFSKVSIEEAFD
jgi:Holliday junction resolvasome RuvABC ATP-dependent DNA helicase subunit